LEKAVEGRSLEVTVLKVVTLNNALLDDPRFVDLLKAGLALLISQSMHQGS
jgi:hypothetical protein